VEGGSGTGYKAMREGGQSPHTHQRQTADTMSTSMYDNLSLPQGNKVPHHSLKPLHQLNKWDRAATHSYISNGRNIPHLVTGALTKPTFSNP